MSPADRPAPHKRLASDEPGVHEFVVDRTTLESERVELAEPDPELVGQLVAEAQRLRKEMAEAHRVLLERMFRVSQMWLAGAALLTGASLWKPMAVAWMAAACFGLGFLLSLYGQRTRPSAPLGIDPSGFNDWASLRQTAGRARQRLLSTWDDIIEQAHSELAWRARWLNICLGALAVATLAVLALAGWLVHAWGASP